MINTKTFLAQARNVQFDVVRFLVGSEANQFQSQTDIRQTLLDAATVKHQGEIVRVFVDFCHENRWLCFINRSPILVQKMVVFVFIVSVPRSRIPGVQSCPLQAGK